VTKNNPSDSAHADAAFAQAKPPAGDRSPTPPKEPGEAVAPSTSQRQPSGPIEATGAGERSKKLQAP
jgi:hypothetical protein